MKRGASRVPGRLLSSGRLFIIRRRSLACGRPGRGTFCRNPEKLVANDAENGNRQDAHHHDVGSGERRGILNQVAEA